MDLADLEALTQEQILSLPQDKQIDLLNLIEYVKYNKIHYFVPFQYQRNFMAAGAKHNNRLLSAGNQLGKTYGASYEFAYHITGLYPDDFEGKRIEKAGLVYWAVGIDLQMVVDIQQKALLGTNNITVTSEIGTGSIPRDCIIMNEGMERDGARVISCRIKHISGGTNELRFFGSTDQDKLQGRTVAMIWLDEESPYSNAIHSQCIARTTHGLGASTPGMILMTATPEQGESNLYRMYRDDKSGVLYHQQVTWWDVPELFTPELIKEKLASLPEWERDLRSKGLPAVGRGAVFPIADDLISFSPADYQPLPHHQVIAGIDFGSIIDPSVVAICVHDTDNDKFYVWDILYLDQSFEARSPAGIWDRLCQSCYSGVPIVVPHDAGLKSNNPDASGKMLQRLGANVQHEPFYNPSDTQLNAKKYGTSSKVYNHKETGLQEFRYLMNEGRLKVRSDLDDWFREKHSYSYTFNEMTRETKPRDKDDHTMDASRYGILSLIAGRGQDWETIQNIDHRYTRTFNPVEFAY